MYCLKTHTHNHTLHYTLDKYMYVCARTGAACLISSLNKLACPGHVSSSSTSIQYFRQPFLQDL